MLELLDTIGRAKPGTKAIVAEAFDAVDARKGGTINLPIGTRLAVQLALGGSISAYVELDTLRQVYIFAEQYHCLALKPKA